MRRLATALFFSVSAAGLAYAQVRVPAGTELHIRLKSPVSSAAKRGDKVEAVLVIPALVQGSVAVPSGAIVRGKVAEANPAKPQQRGVLHLAFDEIAGPDGGAIRIKTRVLNVDNARESVDENGRVLGILASETLSARIDQGIAKVADRFASLAKVLETAKAALMRSADPEIVYDPGVELALTVLEPFTWNAPREGPPPVAALADEVVRIVANQPLHTTSQSPVRPSDPTNLMFIGSEQSLEQAFEAAGWSRAAELTAESAIETIRAIGELRGYKEAPVSILLLEGRRPDFAYQKGNNTFAQRHHLRIWRRPDNYEGKPVWVCAATHDIAIDFSYENATFIHRIDPRIDRERAKVVSDLLFTGRVEALSLVDRPDAPRKTRNATGDEIETDGRMAVLLLK